MQDRSTRPQFGLIEVVCIVGIIPVPFGMFFYSALMGDSAAGAMMILGLVVLPVLAVTIIPTIIAAVIGLRHVDQMTPTAGLIRQCICWGALGLNVFAVFVVFASLAEML